MVETLISFETAKLAKEKGLDLPHTHFYVLAFKSFKEDKVVKKNSLPDDSENFYQVVKNRKNQPHIAPAYSQSQLQKWLRELPTPIIVTPTTDFVAWEVTIDHPDKGRTVLDKNIQQRWFDTYEEALEYGLQHSLTII